MIKGHNSPCRVERSSSLVSGNGAELCKVPSLVQFEVGDTGLQQPISLDGPSIL